jgi:hypothetical protein
MNENMQRANYLRQSKGIRQLNIKAIESIRELYDRGVSQGIFRPGLDPVDIHAAISALTVFNVSNRYTFGTIFDRNDINAPAQILQREQIVQLVLRFVGYSNIQ